MARCLIVGCGCKGVSLARELIAQGHAVRGSTRKAHRCAAIEECGAEAVIGDPDRVATLAPAFEQVTVAILLLGSAVGSREELAALHGSRLEMVLLRILDTTIRGIVYEAAGDVHPEVLRAGAQRVRDFCEDSRIPYALLTSDHASHAAWLDQASRAVLEVLV
ncbi:MAG: NmrA family NAD(P)-binding protein [Actinomycetota bacterium]|nr:NmrA family NAD(P)-binding protein [Actinomycetota bacterium]